MDTQQRTTPSPSSWPGEPVPVPRVGVPADVTLEGEVLHYGLGPPSSREMPAELYLRQARDLDLSDLHEVAEFVAEYGYVAPLDLAQDLPHAKWREVDLPRFSARRGRDYSMVTGGGGWTFHHVDDVVIRLTMLRALTDHALAYREGNYETDAWNRYLERPISDDVSAWEWFARVLNSALREFHVRVTYSLDDGTTLGGPLPSVYEAACLQLANDLTDDLDLRRCAHCGREFYRQVGRSKVQSRLEGVRFCTPACGRAASVKAYRARKRAERKTNG